MKIHETLMRKSDMTTATAPTQNQNQNFDLKGAMEFLQSLQQPQQLSLVNDINNNFAMQNKSIMDGFAAQTLIIQNNNKIIGDQIDTLGNKIDVHGVQLAALSAEVKILKENQEGKAWRITTRIVAATALATGLGLVANEIWGGSDTPVS